MVVKELNKKSPDDGLGYQTDMVSAKPNKLRAAVLVGLISMLGLNSGLMAQDAADETVTNEQEASDSVLMEQEAGNSEAADVMLEEVMVTGTLIARDGYSTPTPVTVVGQEQIQQQASPKLIDYLSTLPAFAGNLTPASETGNISLGNTGTSGLNLRNLGANRTLVLVDGRRAVSSTVQGVVDINSIPSQLVERVEIVTGGASAAYGSDAVSGVVNFILDKDFSGFKGEANAGMTTYGDNENWNIAMTYGTEFAEGRGQFVVSGQASSQDGVLDSDRDWIRDGWQAMYNPDYTPTNGQPAIKVYPNVSPALAGPGGLITSGPLRGVAFGEGGEPFLLNFGPVISDLGMSGGDYEYTSLRQTTALVPEVSIQNVFARVSYDFTDNTNVYVQTQWSSNESFGYAYPSDVYYGDLTVQTSNPFLPASIASQAQALGLDTLRMGSWLEDIGSIINNNTRTNFSTVVGFNSEFNALGTDWGWEGHVQYGTSEQSTYARNSIRFDRLPLALNVVTDPVTGAPICSSTITDPNNGCVPFNVFGTGVNSDRALDYVVGVAHRTQDFKQKIAATSIQGEPFSNWAGPISLAMGLAYREESVTGKSTDLDKQRVFWGGNYLPTNGKYHVTEGFAETIVPLASNEAWAQTLDLNAAIRFTDYSTSGAVTTWKVGLTYRPINDLLFRVTKSRDIRAPNLSDLFNGGTVGVNLVTDPSTKESVVWYGGVAGNPNLDPEKSDSLGIGFVYQPSFAPGLGFSVDYWAIDIKDAINTYSAQRIVNLCYEGATSFCSAINNGQPLHPTSETDPNEIIVQPFNLASETASGVDVEMSYATPMSIFSNGWQGDLTFRALGTFYFENERDDGGDITDTAGENVGDGPPDLSWNASLTYDLDVFSAMLGARGVSSGVIDNSYIQCSSNCPTSTVARQTIDNNKVNGATYFDLSLTYRMLSFQDNDAEFEVFLNVKNFLNEDPEIAVGGPGGYVMNLAPTNINIYDTLGRTYMLGLRFSL